MNFFKKIKKIYIKKINIHELKLKESELATNPTKKSKEKSP